MLLLHNYNNFEFIEIILTILERKTEEWSSDRNLEESEIKLHF